MALPTAELPVVAVDLDEVLGRFVPALIEYHNDLYGTTLRTETFHSYTFKEVWGGSDEEALEKVYSFFKSKYFLEGIKPIEGAREILEKHMASFKYVVVTSRQDVIREETVAWVNLHYPNIFAAIENGNHYDLRCPNPDETNDHVTKRSKPDMCADVGAIALIDDSTKYAHQCCNTLQKVILFGEYAWNDEDMTGVPNVVRAIDWDAVDRYLTELALST
eukprot:m.210471 g.210471  ORF g.210471 m.210471 type:complete len:219 (-) comp33078_c0_seq3:213-869(-)